MVNVAVVDITVTVEIKVEFDERLGDWVHPSIEIVDINLSTLIEVTSSQRRITTAHTSFGLIAGDRTAQQAT